LLVILKKNTLTIHGPMTVKFNLPFDATTICVFSTIILAET